MVDIFVPGAITGFFAIHGSMDIDESGTTGFSLCMSRGLEVRAISVPSKEHRSRYLTNGRAADIPIARHLHSSLIPTMNGIYDITFLYRPQLSIGAGFGMSGATALGTAYCLHRLQPSINYRLMAYRAEVLNRSGYGDVISQINGGAMLRVSPGFAPNIIDISPGDHRLVCAVFGELSTKSILEDGSIVTKINREGSRCLKEAMADWRIERMMELSNRFTKRTGLATSRLSEAIDAVTSVNSMPASMSMLGESLFTLADDEAIPGIIDVLGRSDAEIMVTDIWRDGIGYP
jgi:pantoate kinase